MEKGSEDTATGGTTVVVVVSGFLGLRSSFCRASCEGGDFSASPSKDGGAQNENDRDDDDDDDDSDTEDDEEDE